MFVGYGGESAGAVLELTFNWGIGTYELGTGYGHIAIDGPREDPLHSGRRRGATCLIQRSVTWCRPVACRPRAGSTVR